MFMLPGHGTTGAPAGDLAVYGSERAYPAAAACGFTDYARYDDDFSGLGAFDYYFPDADGLGDDPALTHALDTLADAMVLDTSMADKNARIPPVMTYLGQFIDHDITAGTDDEAGLSVIDVPVVDPLPRRYVAKNLRNLRSGSLNLDSVHGGGPVQGDFAAKLTRILRYRNDRAKLWGGILSKVANQVSTEPQNGIRDLLRLETVLRFGMVTEAELRQLPEELRKQFIDPGTDKVIDQKAIIGDSRNDENLAVAQLHMAVVRLHNAVVQRSYTHPDEHPDAPGQDTDALFDWARRRTQWIYQWLMVNAYLPAICDPDALSAAHSDGPVLYSEFYAQHDPDRPDLLPLPLEFSVAAFRFGHTMVRDAYDWNEFFADQDATFPLLQAFTGNHPDNPMFGEPRLPSNWPIDWARFAGPHDPEKPDRATRPLDARLALPLGSLAVRDAGKHGVLRHLARRNLRRGHRLNIPHAQAVLAQLKERGIDIAPLPKDALTSGATGAAVERGGFHHKTPLWFYILKEAEIDGKGETLGPLGTRLVADTLLGLLHKDETSYVNAAPGGAGWAPADSVRPGGITITDIPSMLKAAGVM